MMQSDNIGHPAGFWIRLVAMIIDGILVGIGYAGIMFVMLAIEMFSS